MKGFPQTNRELNIMDIIVVIKRRILLLLSVFTIVFISGFLITITRPKIFMTSAKIEIGEPREQKDIMGYFSSLGQARRIDTEVQVLKSRTLASEVVKRLKLNVIVSHPEVRVVEFEGLFSVKKEPVMLEIKGEKATLFFREKKIAELRNGEIFKGRDLKAGFLWPRGFSGRVEVKLNSLDSAVSGVLSNLKIEKAGKMSNVLVVKYKALNPILARDVVNTILNVYIENNVEKWAEGAEKTLEFLDKQIEITRKKLEEVESRLDKWRISSGYVELSSEASSLIQTVTDFEMRKVELEMREQQISSLLKTLKTSSDSTISTISTVTVDDPIVEMLLQKLTELEVQKGTLLSQYTPKHPLVVNADAQIKETRARLVDVLDGLKKGISKKKNALLRVINKYDKKMKKLPGAERNLARLERMAKVNEKMYSFLLQKHEEARLAKAATIGNAKIIDPAVLPKSPVEPRVFKDTLIFFAIALLFSFTVIFLQEHFDDTVRIPEDLKGKVDIPIIGVVPFFEKVGSGKKLLIDEKKLKTRKRNGLFIESLRTLRTNLKYLSSEEKKIFMITSPGGEEGKSLICANLALLSSQANLKVALIDCDLRKPKIHKIFGIKNVKGFTEGIVENSGKEEIVKQYSENLYCVFSGAQPPNPAELLNSEKARLLIKNIARDFDYVFIDTPPVLAVSDPLIVSSYATQVILVVESRGTRIPEIENTLNMLKNVNAPVAGIVFNKVRHNELHPYGYNYSYYYHYSGEKIPEEGAKKYFKKFLKDAKGFISNKINFRR